MLSGINLSDYMEKMNRREIGNAHNHLSNVHVLSLSLLLLYLLCDLISSLCYDTSQKKSFINMQIQN